MIFFFFFFLGLTRLLNKYETKVQILLIYKQMHINEFFYRFKPKLFMNNLVHLQLLE